MRENLLPVGTGCAVEAFGPSSDELALAQVAPYMSPADAEKTPVRQQWLLLMGLVAPRVDRWRAAQLVFRLVMTSIVNATPQVWLYPNKSSESFSQFLRGHFWDAGWWVTTSTVVVRSWRCRRHVAGSGQCHPGH